MNIRSKIILYSSILSVMILTADCMASVKNADLSNPNKYSAIRDSINNLISNTPGQIGVAVIIDNTDTISINNDLRYPMMSVYKLHQALAVCNKLDRLNQSLDSLVTIERTTLNPDTWSPMLKEHPKDKFTLSVKDLLTYTLTLSDNNASNYLFDNILDPQSTYEFISTIIPQSGFKIAYTEEEMYNDHDKAYANYTTPSSAASLINTLFTDSIISMEKQSFINATLSKCLTGNDRIMAPLLNIEGIKIAHKTGSGYINHRGEFVAHNDVAYISLPDGKHYSLAIFVKDFHGTEAAASNIIANISAIVYRFLE